MEPSRRTAWIAVIVVAVLVIGGILLLSQCGVGTGDGGGPGY